MLPRHPERISPAGHDTNRGGSPTSGGPDELDQSPGAGFSTGQCIHELFEAQAERSPEAVAVIDENVRLTYGELNVRANRLAHRLRELGVGPDTLVGICLARTERLLVAILAVLKAGGAYVPVDPGYPKERIDFILADAKAPVLITESAFGQILPPEGTQVVSLDPGWEKTAAARDDNPSSGVKPAHLAYVIYTSGSTGQPKGVAIEHRNTVALIEWAREVFTPNELAGVLASTSICFDLSVFEMFVPLSCGGTVIVAENALALPGLPMRGEVTLVNTVPSAIRELVRMSGVPPSVRVINLAGEPLATALVDEIHAGTSAEKVYDLYGPSETTTYSTFALRKPGEPATIGRAIANEKILLLDPDGRPVPAGEAGEIYIGGAGVARGYLNRPELTAERFVPDQSEPGGRLYRTGDLARCRPDGNLEFAGRIDFQVKIRGFRIEPGEIEVVLRQHPGVRDVAVVAREHGEGEEKRLVAYIVGETEAGELRRFLRSKLPEYMTPAAFVFLDALPLSANGKLDRKALPAPDYASAHGVIAPRTPLEQTLVRAWQQILGVGPVGVLDNFFELGGHSLLAIRLVSRLREELALELPLREVFESPNLEALAARIEAIQAAGGQEAALVPGIRAVPRGENPLLSFAQQRLWFLDQIAPGGSAYNIPQNFRLSGKLDIVALEKAIGEIARRHEALRTVFSYENENPVQVIRPPKPFSLPIVDASGEEEARRLARDEACRPFDLRNGPLIRATLVRLATDEHLLLLTLHHIVSDGWSMGVLARELSVLYGAYSKGQPSPLPELPVQYADFAAWQRNLLAGDRLARQLSYWKDHLAGAPLGIALPVDHPPSAEGAHRADVVRFNYPESLTRGLIALSHRTGATLYMTLLGAFEVLLHRLTGQEDLVIGTALAGRNQAETEGLIGFFVNTLPVRANLAGDPPFDQYLSRVRESALGMFSHQDLPFEKLVQELNPERNTTHSPLFPVLFTMDDGLDARTELPGLRTTPYSADCVDAQFDLTLTFAECDGKLGGWFVYDTDLFQPETIQRIAGNLRRLLEGIVAAPGEAISKLPLLCDAERHQLLSAWNATASDYPAKTVHALFAEQAARTPDATAVICGAARLTYRELDERATRLAFRLRSLGVVPEARVGVCLERSPQLLVALLGILKAGGAYVPLDPYFPPARLAMILADSEAQLLVTQRSLHAACADFAGTRLFLDEWKPGQEVTMPEAEVSPANAAYVTYTSGSTGRPKGVVIEHRSVVNLLNSMRAKPGIGPRDVLLAVTTISFDISVLELFLPLTAGACVVIVPDDLRMDGSGLAALMEKSGATIFQATPATWELLLHAGWKGGKKLKALVGGEALPPDLAERILDRCEELWNVYGPTETTIWSLVTRIVKGDAITIGKPVANTVVYIVDSHGQPVPIGVPGELWIGGAGVAREYFNQPALTAERFLPDPFSSVANARVYRTGDRCRWRADGSIEFLGRLDFQVKIRGFRIEPGEIEAVLRAHPGIREAAVVVRGEGEKRLVAYIVGEPGGGELRRFLKSKLPEYMIPAAFVFLEALPLTANRKLDRAALPAPDYASQAHEFIAPRTPLEQTLAKTWREILAVESVGALDNFFELGGHSLIAIRLVSRLREELALEVPLRAVFENQTIETLAARIEAIRAASGREPALLPPIPRAPREGNLPVSFAQQRLWFLDQLSPGSSAYNIPQAFRLRGELNRPALEYAIGEILRRHEVLRTVFSYENDRPVQVILPPASFTLPLVDLSATPGHLREEELRRLAREEAFQPFDLKKGPLMRASLLRLGPGEHVLLLTLHHIVSDGWSMSVMARELSQLYGACSNGLPAPLPELPVQYADFAIWQRDWLQGDQLERQLAYWKQQLRGDLPPINLPADVPRPEIPADLAGNQSRTIPRELSDKLQGLCQQEGVTLFMLLLAAFDVLLHRLAGGEDIVVGTPIAGRNSPETEGLIGFFVNTLVLRADLSGDPTFRKLVARVRDITLDAYTHQDVPFEKLVEELNPDRRLGHTPLFQVMLNMLSVEIDPLELNGFTVEVIPSAQFQTKFDLTLYVTAAGDELGLNAVYNAGLFSEARMAEMLAQFEVLLAQVTARPDMRLSEISLLTDGAKAVVPDPLRSIALAGFEPVTEHFSRLAARAAGKVALSGPAGAWTYAALDAVTNQAAHFLCSRGIRQQDVVAIWTGRHASLAIAMLAAWKAGAPFVILDPDLPPARLLEYLQIARPKGWIDYRGAPALPPALLGFTSNLPCRLTIPAGKSDASIEALRDCSTQPVERHAGPDDLAYITFTSGSTGHPKAIAGSQRPVAHFLQWYCARFGFEESDRFSVLSGLGHDPLLRDILAPLWVGATACFPEPDVFDRPDHFRAWMKDEDITVAHLTPSMATVLTESAESGSLPALRRIFSGGDILRAGAVRQLRAVAPSALCFNFYGATETPQAIACYEVSRDFPTAAAPLPIGQGIDAVQLLILTPSGQLAGVGETGEICVRTPYLAKGYPNDPTLTAARFVTNPFTRRPGDTIYKTGDLGRYLPDGNVEFLGRSDAQVKVRGYRIETGEVETILLTHPAVRQAAVTASEQPGGETCLVAHLASNKGAAIDAAALREFLRQRIPEYMVPSAFLFFDALPLLPNGKIDRKALSALDHAGPDSGKVLMAPRNELELRLVRIWEEVLGHRGIGVRNDFFDLGGHSLLGVRLLARIEKVFDKRLPLSAIFQARNIEQLSAVLRKEGWLSSWYSLVPIQPCGSRPPLFGIHDLHYKDLAGRLGIEQPIYGLRYGLAAHTRDGVAILPSRIEDLAAHYVQEMRALQPEGPYYLMGLSFGGIVAFEMAQQLQAQRQEVALLALFDSYLCPQEHRLPLPDVLSNLLMLGPSAVLDRVKYRAIQFRAKFRKGAYEPHVHHPWGVQRDLADAYVPKTYPGRVLLFKAARPMPTVFHRFDPPEVGWQKWAAGGVELHEVSAGHIDLLEEPHVETVAAMLGRALGG